MKYLGDFIEDATVYFAFTTNDTSGGRASFSASLEEADIVIFKDGSAMTLDASTITITSEPGTRTGVHIISVDMSNDVDFTTGSDYIAVLYPDDETVDSQSPAAVLAHWSCENRTTNVRAINNNANAAVRLALSATQIVPGTVDTVTNTHTPTTTEFQADDITEATADHYNGRIIIFTSGNLNGQATIITDYSQVGGIGQFTVNAMTEAPANNDTFIIV